MLSATSSGRASLDAGRVDPTIAIVARDDKARLELVKAFDRAPRDWVLELHREPPDSADVIVSDSSLGREGEIVYDGNAEVLLASVKERVSRTGRSFVVTSPSGGTGATAVALHLAVELVDRGHATAVVDLDPEQGIRERLCLPPSREGNLPVPLAGGFRLVPSLSEGEGFERLIADAPAPALREGISIDAGILVCAPSLQGARRAAAMIERHPEISWHLVVNRLGPGGETTRARFESLVGRQVLELPCCAALRDAEDEGRLLASGWTRWSRAIARLASKLDDI